PVTREEVAEYIASLSAYKAGGPTDTRNVALQKCSDVLVPVLQRITQASFTLGHHAHAAKRSWTCVLRKPGKDDYSKPGAWRPIALEECEAKIPEGVAARRLIAIAEQHGLLPANQFG
ncbi:hypothetical protein AURDEDRAFT_22794, partial [Auricularia subglabra TFB-10046 SS5]